MSDETTQPKTQKLYENLAHEAKEGSEVTITAAIPVAVLESYRTKTLEHLSKTADIDGFRKGHVPKEVVAQRMGEVELLKDIAEQALADAYPQMVMELALDVVGRPAVSINKLAPGNPVEVTIRTAVMPEVTLPDYQKIAEKKRGEKIDDKELAVTDEEVENVIKNVRQREAHAAYHAAHPDDNEHAHGEIPESDWPEFTDDMAQKLGDFKDVNDFKDKIRDNIKKEKEGKANDKKRGELIDELVKGAKIEVPLIFVESELSQMVQEFKTQVAQMGLTWEGYLEHIKKTEDDVREEWRADAEKRAKTQLILNKIADEQKIVADKEKVEREVGHILEHYQDADPDRVRAYVESMQTNQLVFAWLEKTP